MSSKKIGSVAKNPTIEVKTLVSQQRTKNAEFSQRTFRFR